MPAPHYKILSWGEPVHDGVMGACYVGVAGVAKTSNARHPYAVANEMICGALGRVLLLPIPPGFLVEREGESYYVSLDFTLSGEHLPPAPVARLVAEQPSLAAGIVLFDCWIVNTDRHNRNLAYDTSTKRVQLFDHGHALLRGVDGLAALLGQREQLGLGANHCLRPVLKSFAGMELWHERILSLPEYYIRDVVESAKDLGFSATDVQICTDFLLERRSRLMDLVHAHSGEFPSLVPDLLEPVPVSDSDATAPAPAQGNGEAAPPVEAEEVGAADLDDSVADAPAANPLREQSVIDWGVARGNGHAGDPPLPPAMGAELADGENTDSRGDTGGSDE
jgi:hypothetical protein